MQEPHGAARNAEPPGAASEAAIAQAAVETFVEQHSAGEAPSPDVFVQRYPEQVRPRILAQIREFLAFDGLLGHQEWEPQTQQETAGRAFGDFVIQEELGRGGMGVVYLAHQKSLNRRVALKVMASGLTLSKRHVERFRREAAAAAQLRHPAMVPVHSFTEVDGTFAFAMDFVAGRNLADMLDDLRLANGDAPSAIEGSFGLQPEKGYVAECALLCAQLASALAAAHAAGIVHRDMKPRNVMIDERRQARLLDFGLAKSLGEGSISMSGEITGTAHYMSPEQTLAKRVVVDHRADIWALGVILYELLTLKRPFDGKNLQQVVYEICFKEPMPLHKQNPKVPRDLVTICGKALEKDPGNRYQTAAEFEADLLRFLRWEPIQARPAGLFVRAAKWTHRHRTETLLAGALALAAVGALGYAWYDAEATARRYEELMAQAAAADERGDARTAAQTAMEARLLRDDAAVRARIELYQGRAEVAAKKEEADIATAATLSLKSNKAIDRDRELAIVLALAAVDRRASSESRSAVLDALGCGFRTTKFEVERGQVLTSRWSPDGRLVVTAGSEGKLGNAILWDGDGTLKIVLKGHRERVLDAAFHPRGHLVATAGVDRTVRLWQTSDGAPAGTWAHAGSVTLVRFSRDGGRALTTSDGQKAGTFSAQVWETATGKPLGSCAAHKRMVVAAVLSPCGTYVASAGDRGFVRLWHATTGQELAQLPGQPERQHALAFAPDSSLIAVAALDGTAHLYAIPSGQHLATIAHSRQIDALAFDHDGARLLSGARDQTARLWRLRRDASSTSLAASEVRTFVGHGGEVTHVVFDASGQFAATGGNDGVLRVFDASSGTAAKGQDLMHYEVGTAINEVAFDRDARRILAQAGSLRAVAWDFADTRGVVTLRQPGTVNAACFDATGDQVITAGDDDFVRCWNAHDGRLHWVTADLGNPIDAIDVDTAGSTFALSTHDGKVALHDLATGKPQFQLGEHRGAVPVVRFAAGGTRLLSAGEDQQAIVWNVAERTQLCRLERPARIIAADLSPNGTVLATVERGEKLVRLWNVPDLRARGTLTGHTEPPTSVRFHPAGTALLTGSADGTARITDLADRLQTVLEVGRPVRRVAWSHDGARVLTSSLQDDNRVRLWNVADASEQLHFGGHTSTVEGNAFSADGQWALTTSRDGTARIWPTDPVAAARRLQLRPLSDAERRVPGALPTTNSK